MYLCCIREFVWLFLNNFTGVGDNKLGDSLLKRSQFEKQLTSLFRTFYSNLVHLDLTVIIFSS